MIRGILSFITGGGWKWILILGLISFLAYFARDAYNDYQSIIKERTELAAQNSALDAANSANLTVIREMEEQAQRNEQYRMELEFSLRESENDINRLRDILSRHNLEYLALNKPGLIENRINNATKNVFGDIECYTDLECVLLESN